MKNKLVVLTGAGISAESGLQTFRDIDGLWEGYDVNKVATYDGWLEDPKMVLDFYNMRRKDVLKANPNQAHKDLALLEKEFDVTIITQNIDDLHERGGSSDVLHLHGEIFKMRSDSNANLVYDIRGDINWGDTAEDGGQLRPHIVWFGEAVPNLEKARLLIAKADIFVVIGTSLNVYPAAGLVQFALRGADKYVIDKKIPFISPVLNFTAIEKSATEGVAELLKILILD